MLGHLGSFFQRSWFAMVELALNNAPSHGSSTAPGTLAVLTFSPSNGCDPCPEAFQ